MELGEFARREDALVLALPRGGVPVGFEVALALELPLDAFIVRKLGLPGDEELAMGAIASGGALVLNREVIEALGLPRAEIVEAVRRESRELHRREASFRGGRAPAEPRGRTVLLVDDGLATGSTMLAAIAALRARGPAGIVVAVPVAAPSACAEIEEAADLVVCLSTPERFFGVGQFYRDFSQTSDDEVRELLAASAGDARPDGAPAGS